MNIVEKPFFQPSDDLCFFSSPWVVSDHNDCFPGFTIKPVHQIEDLSCGYFIQITGGFICNKDAESTSVQVPMRSVTADTVTPTESVSIRGNWRADVNDAVTPSESVTVRLGAVQIAVSDTATPSEGGWIRVRLTTITVEGTGVSEATTLKLNARVSASDTVTPTEAVTINLPIQAKISDEIAVTEQAQVQLSGVVGAVTLSAFDAVAVAEAVSVAIGLKNVASDVTTPSEAGWIGRPCLLP